MDEIKALLYKFDEKDCYEFPSSFNAADLACRARRVFDALQAHPFSVAFEDWSHNQDASFGLSIPLLDFEKRENNIIAVPTIRFSNFGDLVTILGIELISENMLHLCCEAFRKNGFNYIPEPYLKEAYDGVMQAAGIFRDWGVRYFDYI